METPGFSWDEDLLSHGTTIYFPNVLNNINNNKKKTKLLQILAAYKTKASIWFSALPYSRAAGWFLRSCAQITSVHHHPGPPGRCCSSGSSSEPLCLLRCLLCASVCGGGGGGRWWMCVSQEVHISRDSMESIFEKNMRQLTTPLTESLWDMNMEPTSQSCQYC